MPTDLPEPGSPYQTLISPMARRWCTSQTFLLLVLRSANSVPRRMRPLCCGVSSDACVPLSVQSGAWSTSALKGSTVPPGGEPVACVTLLGEAGQRQQADARRLAGERAGHFLRMLVAVLVIVRDDDHVGADQVLGKGRVPLVCTTCIAGRRDAVAGERENVLLALDHEQPMFQRQRLDELGQAERHLPHTFDAPHPAILHLVRRIVRACPAPLAKGLRLEAADLEQQRAGFVGVVVSRDDLEPLRAIVVGVAEIRAA